ncbi:MAG: hypothetical protein BGO43_14035 [Gammaproteobacteria bacterium 39-13]|nr:FIST C-terminal domain-containing protein [Gammaproteobacteria bacterium]OJV89809.1 MAG: hypothetical protein BGO43_14035 [Gammaproteobacteria bacterium 39-13]
MHVETFHFEKNTGWSVKKFPNLDSKDTLILAFCAPEYFDNPQPFTELKEAFPNSIFAGCSTAGEIFKKSINDHSISVAAVKFDKSRVRSATAQVEVTSESFSAGQQLAKALLKEDLQAILILSDGLVVNGSTLVEGLKQHLPPHVIVTGGLAGDGSDFKKTWVLQKDVPVSHSVTAIGFYGKDLEIGYGSRGGWDIFGPERLITRSNGNVLYEIDGQPALALYKKYLGDRAKELPSSGLLFPLAISEKPLNAKQVVRTILSVDEKNQSITFAGDIPEGWYGQLMKANFDRLIDGASKAGELAKKQIHSPENCLGIAISCVGRRLVLGDRTEEEVEASHDMLGENSSLIGFYSYGEISPSGLGSCDLHNQTMTLTAISEK